LKVVNKMVGISGWKDRQIEILKDEFGNYVVVFSGWKNWDWYYRLYAGNLKIEEQWQWKQNYPELVVEDIMRIWDRLSRKDDKWKRNWLYADLLYRGVNKWLFVRYLLIRYKKLVVEWRNDAYRKMKEYESKMRSFSHEVSLFRPYITVNDIKLAYHYGYWKGYYDAMNRVRADLKTMCNTPRYVVWNGSRPGFVVDKKIRDGWLRLVQKLYNAKFEK